MCVVSFIGDDWTKKDPWKTSPGWPKPGEGWPMPLSPYDQLPKPDDSTFPDPKVSWTEFSKLSQQVEAFRKELEELKVLLQKAKEYDDAHNEPNCELEEKIALIKQFGKVFSIDFTGIFDNEDTDKVEEEKEYEPYAVMAEEGIIARFTNAELAKKFAEYIKAYSGKLSAIVYLEQINLSLLKFAVFKDSDMVAAFVDQQEAVNYAKDNFDAESVVHAKNPEKVSNYRVVQI